MPKNFNCYHFFLFTKVLTKIAENEDGMSEKTLLVCDNHPILLTQNKSEILIIQDNVINGGERLSTMMVGNMTCPAITINNKNVASDTGLLKCLE